LIYGEINFIPIFTCC